MGIYIKDMETPTRCGRCDMRIAIYDDGAFDHYECCITAAIIDNVGEKMEDCPLIPVPPHGRLIDADALTEKLKKHREYHSDGSNSGAAISNGIGQCLDIINGRECPTIIEAEEGE